MHSQQRGIVFWIQKGNKRASQNREMLLLEEGRAQELSAYLQGGAAPALPHFTGDRQL